MFKVPQLPSIDFPSIDLSRLDVEALRNSDLVKRLSAIDIAAIDTDKVGAVVRDAAYLTVGLGVVAVEQAGHVVGQARDFTRVAREQVRGLIRSAA